MRKRILTIVLLAAALAASLIAGSTAAGGGDPEPPPDPLDKVVFEKTNDANADNAYTDSETALGGEVPYRLEITNDSDVDVVITELFDDRLPLSLECQALIGVVLKPGESAGCFLSGPLSDFAFVNTAEVVVETLDGSSSRKLTDTSTVLPAPPGIPTAAFNARIHVEGSLVDGKLADFDFMVDEDATEGPVLVTSAKLRANVKDVSVDQQGVRVRGVAIIVVPASQLGSAKPHLLRGWSLEGDSPTDLDIREFGVKDALPAVQLPAVQSDREAKVTFELVLLPDALGEFSGDVDIGGIVTPTM